MQIFTISDHHFYHKNIIKYCKRPFEDLEEMHDVMIDNWNRVVNSKDVVIHVGDFALADKIRIKDLLDQLNGYFILISGNHDRRGQKSWEDNSGILKYYKGFMKINNSQIIFRHRPDYKLKKKIVIHGHIHEKKSKQKNHINVSVEQLDYTPININEILNYYQVGKVKKFVKNILEKNGKMNNRKNNDKNNDKNFMELINNHFR